MSDESARLANDRVATYILEQFRGEKYTTATAQHLYRCDSIRVIDPDAQDGDYGCDTGCDYTRFTATIACDHGQQVDYEYGEFGMLSDILAGL